MNKKTKLQTVKKLAGHREPELTEEEKQFIDDHMTPGGLVIVRNPGQEDLTMAETLTAKGVKLFIIKRKIISNEN